MSNLTLKAMKKLFKSLFLTTIMVVSFGLSSCSNEFVEMDGLDENAVQEDLIGMDEFESKAYLVLEELSCLAQNYDMTSTRAMEASNDSIDRLVDELIIYSIDAFSKNGVDVVAEFGSDKDPRIALCGMGLIEYQSLSQVTTRASLGGCVLEGLGLRELLNKKVLSKTSVKRVLIKAGLKKAVPYLGWGLAIADFANCMVR